MTAPVVRPVKSGRLGERLVVPAPGGVRGGEESPGYLAQVRRFDERLQSRHYPGLRYKWRLVDGERHSGTKPESYNRAVRLRVRAARRQPERQLGAQPNVSPFQPQR
jgi:hypothetical protein